MSINAPNMENFSIDHRNWPSDTWANNYSEGIVVSKRLRFREVDHGAGWTYTGIVNLPKNAVLHNIVVVGKALWDDTGTVTLEVGDSDTDGTGGDADGFYVSTNLKATALLVDETLSFSAPGGLQGAYLALIDSSASDYRTGHLTNLEYPDGGQIRAVIVAQNGNGSAGLTDVDVYYSVPNTVFPAGAAT